MSAVVSWRLAFDPVGERDCVYALSCSTQPEGPLEAGVICDAAAMAEALQPPGLAPAQSWADLWRGPLVEQVAERGFAIQLGSVLLPERLRKALLSAPEGERHLLTVSARGWLSQLPWDLAALDEQGDVRLCQRATVVAAIAPTAQVGRRRRARDLRGGAALLIVDPGARSGGHDRLAPLYSGRRLPEQWRAETGGSGASVVHPADSGPVGSTRLGELLTSAPYRQFTYFGHVVGGVEGSPAAARLVLADDDDVRTRLSAHTWLMSPDRWPMPAHVALIGCGSDDAAPHERSGLPMAAINAGARVVTATRWTLPNDDPATPVNAHGATTGLAWAVTLAQATAQPVQELRAWQLGQLERWRREGSRDASPLLWAALVSYVAPD